MEKVSMHNGRVTGIAALGDVHLAIWLERHPDVGDECLGDNLLAAFAKARVPQGCFVKEAACVRGAAFAYISGGAFGDVGNGAGAYAASVLSTILQLLPDVEEKLYNGLVNSGT
jgi:hypothetical protein